MPRYLALDYAFEALKEHQNFISVFLLATPSSFDLLGQHGLAGISDDYSYRFPWLQVKGSLKSLTNYEDIGETIKQIVPLQSRPTLESISDAAIFIPPNEDDIVPSSNPDSPPLDSQTKHTIQSELNQRSKIPVGNSFSGEYSTSEEEGDFGCDGSGREYSKFMLESLFDVTSDLRRHQMCEEMCKHLAPKAIKDPFSNLPLEQRLEKLQFRAEKAEGNPGRASSQLRNDVQPFHDVWKEPEKCNKEDLMLPELVSSSDNLKYIPPPLCDDVMPDHCLRMQQNDYHCFDWSDDGFLKSSSCTKDGPEQEKLLQVDVNKSDPVKLNSEGLAVVEAKGCSSEFDHRSLEPPRTPTDSTSKNPKDTTLEHQKIPMTPVACFDAEIVSPSTKEKTENRMWKAEQFLHEAVALSLKVPEVPVIKNPDPPLSPKSQLGLTKEYGNSDVDLLVPWQPVNISQGKKFIKSLEELDGIEKEKMLDNTGKDFEEPVIKEECSPDENECEIPLEPLESKGEKTGVSSAQLKIVLSEGEVEEGIPDPNPTSKKQSSTERKEDVRPKKRPSSSFGDPLMDFLKLRCKESLIEKKEPSPIKQLSLPPPLIPAVDKMPDMELPTKVENEVLRPSKPITIKKEAEVVESVELELTPTKSGNKKSKSRLVEVDLTGNIIHKLREKPFSLSTDGSSDRAADEQLYPVVVRFYDDEVKHVVSALLQIATSPKNSTAPFVEMINVLEEALLPVISHLHSINALSPSYTFSTLTTDVTRFLLIQHEKQYGTSTEKDDVDKHKHIILLYSYVTAIDLMLHCDAASSIMHLAITNERHKDILQGSLDTVRNTLFKKHCLLPKHTLHPKLHEMARLTGEWFQKKLKKEGRDHDPKVLVIIRREYAKLAETVASVLLSVKGLSASTLSSTAQTTYVAVSEALDKHNCLVITPTQIDESFPWAHFSLVIEYEASPKSPWKELCLRQKIRHIELRCVSHVGSGASLGHISSADGLSEKKAETNSKQVALKLIGSEKVINSSKLLHILETRYNILIVERSIASSRTAPAPQPTSADLILDERTGILIIQLESMLGEGAVEPLVHRITMLSQQFTLLWVILEGNGHSNRYALGGHVVVNTCRLQAALTQFTVKSHDFQVKVMYSCDSASTASTIDQISSIAKKASTAVWNHDDWLTRPWLTDRLSKHERFLTSFPCVNSFVAQVMLTAAPLPVLLSAPLTYLTKLCPWVPTRILSSFYRLVHDESLYSDRPSKLSEDHRREELISARGESMSSDNLGIDQEIHGAFGDTGQMYGKEDSHRVGYDERMSDLYAHQKGRAEGWSMLRNERRDTQQKETQGQALKNIPLESQRQKLQDVPVIIKSEPESPAYDLDGEEPLQQEQYIPDDLKTPLELFASSERYTRSNYDSPQCNAHLERFDRDKAMATDSNIHLSRSAYGNPQSNDHLERFDRDKAMATDSNVHLSRSAYHNPHSYDHCERFDRDKAMAMDSDFHSSQVGVDHLSHGRMGRHGISEDLSSLSALGHATMPARDWTCDGVSQPNHHSRAGVSHGREESSLASQHRDSRCQEWDARRRWDAGDYSQLGGIQFTGQSTGMQVQRKNTRSTMMDPFSSNLKGATMKYIGIAQPCPRAAGTRNPLQKKTSSINKNFRSGEFGTLATVGLPARRVSSSSQNQDKRSQVDQQHSLMHTRDDHWCDGGGGGGGGGDAAMSQRPSWLQGEAASYQYQGGDDFHGSDKLSYQRELYTNEPTKRRLTYERVPGSKGGQTKLTFR